MGPLAIVGWTRARAGQVTDLASTVMKIRSRNGEFTLVEPRSAESPLTGLPSSVSPTAAATCELGEIDTPERGRPIRETGARTHELSSHRAANTKAWGCDSKVRLPRCSPVDEKDGRWPYRSALVGTRAARRRSPARSDLRTAFFYWSPRPHGARSWGPASFAHGPGPRGLRKGRRRLIRGGDEDKLNLRSTRCLFVERRQRDLSVWHVRSCPATAVQHRAGERVRRDRDVHRGIPRRVRFDKAHLRVRDTAISSTRRGPRLGCWLARRF